MGAGHVPLHPLLPPSSAMLSPLLLPTLTFTDVAKIAVVVLRLFFVTGPNIYNLGMRAAIAGENV